jgi:hypothetical protein
VRREVSQLVAQQRWPLLELRTLGLSLEEIFIRVVAGEEHEAGEAEPAAEPPDRPTEESEVTT